MKLKLMTGALVVALAGLYLGACVETATTPGGVNEADSLEIAREYLESSPTFQYDGIDGSIVHTDTLDAFCEGCWGFVFEFQCTHAGYGDRTGEVVAQVITSHEAVISVSSGQVDGGTIDGYWNMEAQQPVGEPEIQTATHQ